MWNTVITLFRNYMGTGLIVGLFLVSLVYLFLAEKEKRKRLMFLYVPVVVLILYFQPLFAKLVLGVLGNEIYYRILWLLPITLVIAYVAVDVCRKLQGMKRVFWCLVCACLIMVSGSNIYQNQFFKKAENVYHIPQTVVDICDEIIVEGREVMAVFPFEMLQYVRQYTPYVCMPYGREVMIERWKVYNELLLVMEADEVDVERMAALCKGYGCHYVIVNSNKILNGDVKEYAYELFAQIDGYDIYVDTTMDRGL